MSSIPGYDAWKLRSPEDEMSREPNDDYDDSPEADAAYQAKWQRAVDNGEFCPTCGRDAEHIIAGKCGGPHGQVVRHFKCVCGDEWFGEILNMGDDA